MTKFKGVVGMLVCVLIVMIVSSFSCAEGLGTYSQGYRMGQLTKFSIKGLVFKSGEGQMLMGAESTSLTKGSGENKKLINPWYFSSVDKNIHRKLNANVGEYVVLSYNEAQFKYSNVNTAYDITEVIPISSPVSETCTATSYREGNKSQGTMVGRIVKASSKGTVVKTWELMFQQGNSGNQFKNMTISKDPALFECAVRFLKAGQKVKIYYTESHFNMSFNDTAYDVFKLEPIKELN